MNTVSSGHWKTVVTMVFEVLGAMTAPVGATTAWAGKFCKRNFFLAASVFALLVSIGTTALADPVATGQPQGLRNEQEIRKKQQQEYTRQHSDPSGKVRPDAYIKGIEHARQMKVAPYIGAPPPGETSSGASGAKSNK